MSVGESVAHDPVGIAAFFLVLAGVRSLLVRRWDQAARIALVAGLVFFGAAVVLAAVAVLR